MKKLLILAICAATVSAYALPTYEPFTEFAPTLATNPVTLVVTTPAGVSIGTNANNYVTNCLDLSTNGFLAPSGEQWGELAFAGLTTGGMASTLHGIDIAIVSNVNTFSQSALSSILPSTFPGMPTPGQSITNFVENASQPFLWTGTNFSLSNYCGNSAVLKFASDITRPGSGTKTMFFSYVFNLAQAGQLAAGNNGRYLALLSQTNLSLPSTSYPNWDTLFNTYNGTSAGGVHYASHGLLADNSTTYYIGGCDSAAGKNWSTTPLTGNYGSSVFVVGCYLFNAGGSDSNIMWLNPNTGALGGATPPTSSVFAFKMGFNMSDIGGLAFIDRVGNNASGGVGTNYIGNLIIGSTWSYVTGGPEFTNQPVGFTGSAGATATFTAQATAAAQTVSYQWQVVRNGTTNNLFDGNGAAGGNATVSGSQTSTLTLSGISSADAGVFQCVGTASSTTYQLTSSGAILRVDPSIVTQPQNSVANYQGTATFTASANTAQATISYQWYYNGNPLTDGVQSDGSVVSGSSGTASSNAVTTTLTLTNVSYLDQGNYSVFVTNNVNNGSFSGQATLTVNDPYIVASPTNDTVVKGGTAMFSVSANGSPTVNYQWYANGNFLSDGPTGTGSTISGSQTSTLTISGVSDADAAAGPYYATVNGFGSGQSTNSASATLVVADPVTFPSGISGPFSRVERAGDHTAFSVVAAGNVLSYQWQFNGTNITGATASALTVTNIQSANAGSYDVVVSNPASPGGVPSPVATLTVINSLILPLASSNIVVVRVGDGAQSFGGKGNTIYLDQYTTNGTYVSTVQVPDENTGQPYGTGGSNSTFGSPALLAQGGANDDSLNSMFVTLSSANQEFLNFAAYCHEYPYAGTDVTTGTGASNNWRGLGAINAFGVYSLVYTNNGLYNGGPHTIRGVVSSDETNFWTTGQAGANGIKYVNSTVASYATGGGIPVVLSSATNTRVVQIIQGNLIFSDGGGGLSPAGLYACVGTPEPSPNGTISNVVNLINTGGQPNDFAFSPDARTVYIADGEVFQGTNVQAGGIQRWDTNDGSGSFSYSYTIEPLANSETNGAQGLTVTFPANISSWGSGVMGAVLYATSYGTTTNSLVQIVDNGPASTPTVIATASPNQAFRGVRFGPSQVPVSIATQPQSQTNFPNNSVTFTVGALGSQPIFYQWEFGGTPIPGATSSSFTTNNITFASGGNYSVIVSNLIPSSVTSSNALLTVTAGAPSFTAGVQSYAEGAGDHLAFAPTAVGSTPLSAQWYFNNTGNPIAGATNVDLILTNIQTGESGSYLLVLSNIYGTAQSSGTLIVTPRPTSLSTNNIIVARIGDGAQALSGVTGNTLYLDQYTTGGSYVSSVQIPDEGTGQPYGTGSTTAVGTGPAVIMAGASGPGQDANLGALLTLSVDNQTINFGGYCLAYPFGGSDVTVNGSNFWRGIGAVSGVGAYTLAYTNFGLYSAGNHVIHTAMTSDHTNYWTTGEASQDGLKYVNSGPSGAGYANGNGVPNVVGSGSGCRGMHIVNGNIFFVDMGTSPFGIWELSGEPTGAEAATSFLPETNSAVDFAISPDQQTIYVADNSAFGSGGGIERWDYNPNTTSYTNSYTFATGLGFTVGARGLTVDFSAETQWGLGVNGAKIYATTAESSGNRLIKILDNGASSAVATLATAPATSTFSGVSFGPATTPVSIVSEPQNQTALIGTGAEFSVGATGTAPFFYQWQFNGTNLPGATSSTLIVSPAQAVLPGTYSVIVSNLAPSIATSGPVAITFEPILSFFGNGSGWSQNGQSGAGVPLYGYNGGSNIVELTQGVGHQASGTFYQYPVYVGGFLATWTYQVVNPSGTIADGMAFVVQNDARGAAALGDTSFQSGGSLGYGAPGPITNSVALEFDVFTNAAGGEGIALDSNGAIGPNTSTSPVDFGTGDPINVTVQYLNGIASVTLFDTVNSNMFSTSAPINVPAVVGGEQAFVGFTAADGADFSTQTVSNFVYVSLVDVTATTTGSSSLTLTWPVGVGGFTLQQSADLTTPAWTPVTNAVSVVGGSNQVVVPIASSKHFYRLVNP